MKNVLYIARRELASFFVSPIAYVVAAVYLAVMGGMFGLLLYYSRVATLSYLFYHYVTLLFLILITQLLTMRLLAEEQRQGSLELLLTSPVRDTEVILGKYLSGVGVFVVMLLLTGSYPLLLSAVGAPDIGPMLSGYLGYFLMGAAMLAIGLFASSLTQSQIVSAIIGIGINLVLWLSGSLGDIVGDGLRSVVEYLPLFEHYDDFVRGVIDTSDVVYFVSVIVVFLFLSTRVIESRRWK